MNRALAWFHVAAAVAMTLSTGPSSAALISQDLISGTGDENVTLDTTTNLQWMDLTQTNGYSVNEIVNGDAGGIDWIALGWRYATLGDVCGLFQPRTGSLTGCGGSFEPISSEGVIELQSYLGITLTVADLGRLESFSHGFFQEGRASLVQQVGGDAAAAVFPGAVDPSVAERGFGSFLVRAVPEPGVSSPACILAVFSLALAARFIGKG